MVPWVFGGRRGCGCHIFNSSLPARVRLHSLAADVGAKKQFNGLLDVVKQIRAKEGVGGLYRGYPVSVVGIVVYRAGYFGFYDAGKQVFFKDGGQNTSVFLKFGLALCVDISAAVFAYPVDTVRRRLMMQSGAEECRVRRRVVRGEAYYQKEGVGGFFAVAWRTTSARSRRRSCSCCTTRRRAV